MLSKQKRILITGSEGVIGNLLSDRLINYDILKLDKVAPENEKSFRLDLQSLTKLNNKLRKMLPIDCILHLAADAKVDAKWDSILKNNIIATRTIFEFARKNNVPKIIYASSNHVTGFDEEHLSTLHTKDICKNIITAEMPLRPDGYYGVSKIFGEALGRYFSDYFNIKIICLRIGTVLKNDNPKINIRFRSTWLSHRDLVTLIMAAIESNVPYGIYYGVSNNQRRFWDITNAKKDLNYFPKDDAEEFYRREDLLE